MENLDAKLTWEKVWKQSWSEWDLKNIIPLLEERLKEIIKPKDTVTDYDKAEWESSVICVIHQLLPPRFFIRFIEEENNFVFQFFDSSRTQEPQSVKVPYRKVFDWGVESWKDALQLSKSKRIELLNHWRSKFRDCDIVRHFNISDGSLRHFRQHTSSKEALELGLSAKSQKAHSTLHRLRRICTILERENLCLPYNSLTAYFRQIFDMKPGAKISKPFKDAVSVDESELTADDYDKAIGYLEYILKSVKEKIRFLRNNKYCYFDGGRASTQITVYSLKATKIDIGFKKCIRDNYKTRYCFDAELINRACDKIKEIISTLNQKKGKM